MTLTTSTIGRTSTLTTSVVRSTSTIGVRPVALAPARIRAATAADHAAIRDVIVRAYQQYEADLPADLFAAYLTDLLDLDGRIDAAVLLVAEVDGAVVGTVTFSPDAAAQGLGWPPGWAGFRAVAVAPTHRQRGIAGQLVDACVDRAQRLGAPVIALHTASFMSGAVRVYERRGFTRSPAFDQRAEDLTGVGGPDGPVVIAYQRNLRRREHSTWTCIAPI